MMPEAVHAAHMPRIDGALSLRLGHGNMSNRRPKREWARLLLRENSWICSITNSRKLLIPSPLVTSFRWLLRCSLFLTYDELPRPSFVSVLMKHIYRKNVICSCLTKHIYLEKSRILFTFLMINPCLHCSIAKDSVFECSQ
jgi:hypothetical protein